MVEGIRRASLPTLLARHRTHQVDPALLAADQQIGLHIAFIDQMGLRQEVAHCEIFLNRLRDLDIMGRGGRGFDLGDEPGLIRITRFGHMHLVADPFGAAGTSPIRSG